MSGRVAAFGRRSFLGGALSYGVCAIAAAVLDFGFLLHAAVCVVVVSVACSIIDDAAERLAAEEDR